LEAFEEGKRRDGGGLIVVINHLGGRVGRISDKPRAMEIYHHDFWNHLEIWTLRWAVTDGSSMQGMLEVDIG
jgi:hypothetical protein